MLGVTSANNNMGGAPYRNVAMNDQTERTDQIIHQKYIDNSRGGILN